MVPSTAISIHFLKICIDQLWRDDRTNGNTLVLFSSHLIDSVTPAFGSLSECVTFK